MRVRCKNKLFMTEILQINKVKNTCAWNFYLG
jgi:hypothetical protein